MPDVSGAGYQSVWGLQNVASTNNAILLAFSDLTAGLDVAPYRIAEKFYSNGVSSLQASSLLVAPWAANPLLLQKASPAVTSQVRSLVCAHALRAGGGWAAQSAVVAAYCGATPATVRKR
jgi:hypothetical protein